MKQDPYRRLERMVPGLVPGMPIEVALEKIADRMEVLDRANQINLIPVAQVSKDEPSKSYPTSGDALRARHDADHQKHLAAHIKALGEKTIEAMYGCIEPGRTVKIKNAFQDAIIFGKGHLKVEFDESHSLPVSNRCDHDFRPSDSVPGKSHWCSKCDERK